MGIKCSNSIHECVLLSTISILVVTLPKSCFLEEDLSGLRTLSFFLFVCLFVFSRQSFSVALEPVLELAL